MSVRLTIRGAMVFSPDRSQVDIRFKSNQDGMKNARKPVYSN